MSESQTASVAIVDEASAPFLGQWNRLVSTTNWEKGRIIHEWRQALVAAEAPPGEFADEAWSVRVGNVTGQHVGRLRRVYERFDGLRSELPSLYWSHFQAALDWDDAEMWLEGAYQSGWSVAEMRRQRNETLGAVAASGTDEEPIAEPLDEDADVADSSATATLARPLQADGETRTDSHGNGNSSITVTDEPPFDSSVEAEASDESPAEPRRPFAHLAELPDDLGEPYEALKVAIIRHKFTGWSEISRDDVLTAIDALRELTLLPAET